MWIRNSIVFLLLPVLVLSAADPVDLSKVERKIDKQPKYVSDAPLFGLAVFGPAAKSKVWMVLDKSAEDAEAYDVLYADLNGNGSLAEASEKIVTDGSSSRIKFTLPDFKDAISGQTHTGFTLTVSSRSPATHMISVLWDGKQKIGGGYPADPDGGYLRFAKSIDDAPIVWFNGDGPMQFQRWYSSEFEIGGASDLKVFLGQKGVGNSSFCAFQRHVLPDDEPVLATLIYEDNKGEQHEVQYELKERC